MTTKPLAALTALLMTAGALVGLTLGTAAPAGASVSVYPVPTSNAGLERIVTGPDGNMWFVERDANKVGRITPQGVISEVTLPARFPGTTKLTDLEIGPDGTVWVVYESGRFIAGLGPAADGSVRVQPIALLSPQGADFPYGEEVRIGPDGAPWVTMNFDRSGVARVVGNQSIWNANAPACDDTLGRGRAGTLWCNQGGSLVRINADATGGSLYPLPANGTFPEALAPGPVGSVWFARHSGATIFSSAGRGSVGYLEESNGATRVFDTGSLTAPEDLVQGPDASMWFTSVGTAKGIGHVDALGRGALTQVGNYRPESLTFGVDGAVWFTDAVNNAIVRVTTDQLQVTNVDPGTGSVFTLGATAAGGLNADRIKVKATKRPIRARGTRVPLTLSCAKKAAGGCQATLTLRTAKKVRAPGKGKKSVKATVVVSKPTSVRIKAGKNKTVSVKLNATGKKVLRRGSTTPLRVLLDGDSAKKIKVRR